jgi:D-alanine-D-alanine ligase
MAATRQLKILVLFDTDHEPPADQDFSKQLETSEEAEFDVARALIGRGHTVRLLGIRDRLEPFIEGLRADPVDLVFNLTEGFGRSAALDYAVTSILEMFKLPYTGSPPAGLILARDKALTKKILAFHGIRFPHFMVYPRGAVAQRSSDLRFPLIVKPLDEDASVGIAQASVVKDDDALHERVMFLHEKLDRDAIVEEFIAGRELYIGVLGNDPPRALAPVEMLFDNQPSEEGRIATFKAKWSAKYRTNKGIRNVIAKDIPPELAERLSSVAVRAYKALRLRDYGRVDVRLAPDDEIYVVEANPNPFIAKGEDLADAALDAGLEFPDLIESIVELAMPRTRSTVDRGKK